MRDDIGGRIDRALMAEAETLGIDVVAACEAGLMQAIRGVRGAARLAESRAAIAEWNGWAETGASPVTDTDPA